MKTDNLTDSASGEASRLPVRHIGYANAICGSLVKDSSQNIVRQDLGAKRYRKLGVSERFKGEKPYRVCKRCISVIQNRENLRFVLRRIAKAIVPPK